MKKLPIGIQSIQKILNKGEYIYVDKTGFIKRLVDEGAPHYFMSRPRRFGKSLFLDTLGEIFKGNKQLFKGYQIYNSDYDWEEYQVVHLDFSKIASNTPDQLETALKIRLEIIANEHDISIITADIQVALDTLIVRLSNKYQNKAVVLIDEYDNPIINNLKTPEVAEQNKDLLKTFFTTLKSLDRHLKFTFTTGVSKFSQVSLFSGPNNLKDISMDRRYAGMMGYTEEELRKHFVEHVQAVIKERDEQGVLVTEDQVFEEIREWYNGYRFSKGETCVYNPFSTLNFMDGKEAKSYWYSTGTPSFLIDQVKKSPRSIISLKGTRALESTLSDISKVDRINLPALMFQTGYLTIIDYETKTQAYSLDFPNKEVKQAFFDSLLQEFTEISPIEIKDEAKEVRKDLEEYNLDSFVGKMNSHFAKIAYPVFSKAKEGFYQAVFFTFLEKSGITTTTEMMTNIGRIDLVSDLDKVICIFELKLDKSAKIALTQAETRKYKEKFLGSGKPTLVVGINFSSTSRNISGWEGELFSSDGKLERKLL